MAFGDSAVLRDDFTGTNGSNIDSAKWTPDAYGAGDSSPTIQSNSATSPGSGYASAYYDDASFGADCEVYITIATRPGSANDVGVLLRMQSPGTSGMDGYSAQHAVNAGTDQWRIVRIDNGVETQLGALVDLESANGDKLGIEAIGSDIAVYRNNGGTWTQLATRTDSTYSGAGYTGFYCIGTTVRLDDFYAGTVVVSATLEQEGFRFRNDDGSESTATWRQAQDTNDSVAVSTTLRLRMLLNATGNPDPGQYKLQYRKVGDDTWMDVQ
jgi:hypothetical protein